MSILDDLLRQALRMRYPDTLPPVLAIDKSKGGKEYLAKNLSDEAKKLQKERKQIQTRIDANDYDPYFDVNKRFDVDPKNYNIGPNQTLGITPKKTQTIEKYRQQYNDPEAFKRLQEAYLKGLDIPDSDKWYFMGQLEKEFIDEYGPTAGRTMFKNMFADPMAAWTGGADPTSNLLMAMYDNFRKFNKANLPENAYDYPFPIGGRFLGTNARNAQKIEDAGGLIDFAENPKRFNFSTNFQGASDRATMDEVMSTVGYKLNVPVRGTYGLSEEPVHRLANKYGTDPRNMQEVIWHGGKEKTGKPMIQFVNEAIERTSSVTGMAPKDVVKGMVRGSIPIFGLGGAAALTPTDTRDILNYLISTERSN